MTEFLPKCHESTEGEESMLGEWTRGKKRKRRRCEYEDRIAEYHS
jgi:hypothetical protein